jgi:hypothetical protein
MVDGHGDPNTAKEYTDAIGALYRIAYKLKFASKQDLGKDYVVMPLEALWWASDMDSFTTNRDKSQWNWTAMIMVPDPPVSTNFAWTPSARGDVFRLFTSARMTTRRRFSQGSTRSTSPTPAYA